MVLHEAGQERGAGAGGAGKRSRMKVEDGWALLLGQEGEISKWKASSVDICETELGLGRGPSPSPGTRPCTSRKIKYHLPSNSLDRERSSHVGRGRPLHMVGSWKRKRRADALDDPVGGLFCQGQTSGGERPLGAARNSLRPSEEGGGLALTQETCELQSVFVTKFREEVLCRSGTQALSYGITGHGGRPMAERSI